MSVLSSRPALRWLVPAAVAVAVVGGGAAIGQLAAVAEPSLPERSAAQLLVDVQTARLDGLSGTVVQTADLGLPELPLAGQLGGGLTSLVSGSNTLRVWYSGPDKARLALLSSLGETDLIRNGRDVWVWQSRGNTGQHFTLPADVGEHGGSRGLSPDDVPATPQRAADLALEAIGPSTEVSVGRNAQVAGRDVYELVLAPRDKASLVGQIRIGIDAVEHLPLRVEVFAKGVDDPAFEVAFKQISFERPDESRFRFNPPPGAKIEEQTDDAGKTADKADKAAQHAAEKARPGGDAVVGEGWTSVYVTRLGDAAPGTKPGAESEDPNLALLDRLPKVSGAWGSGRLLKGTLFSALLTDDGRLVVGAVAPERLYEVAGSAAAKVR
jgi:outer membrane lipoprotein-sorting protein